MNDVLSAMSAVITFIAILYALWYDDIEKVITTRLPPSNEDAKELKRKNFKVLLYKALPLFIVSAIFFLMFLPNSVEILLSSIKVIQAGNYVYDSTNAAIVFIDILGLIFIILTFYNICKMYTKC